MKFFNEMKDYNRQKCVPTTIIISQVTHKQVGVCDRRVFYIYKHNIASLCRPSDVTNFY